MHQNCAPLQQPASLDSRNDVSIHKTSICGSTPATEPSDTRTKLNRSLNSIRPENDRALHAAPVFRNQPPMNHKEPPAEIANANCPAPHRRAATPLSAGDSIGRSPLLCIYSETLVPRAISVQTHGNISGTLCGTVGLDGGASAYPFGKRVSAVFGAENRPRAPRP